MKTNSKTIQFPDSIHIHFIEHTYTSIEEAIHYHGNLWPCAMYLSLLFSKHPHWIRKKVILELGAGLFCLPTLTALKYGAELGIVTDQSLQHLPPSLPSLLSLNQLSHTLLHSYELKWGNRMQMMKTLQSVPTSIDLIIGADILFHPKVYDSVFATFFFLANAHVSTSSSQTVPTLLLAYQQRSSSQHFLPLLEYWNLEVVQIIPAASLMSKDEFMDWQQDSIQKWDTSCLESIFIIHIQLKKRNPNISSLDNL
ncbi:Methyltransferase-like protein 23 [Coelomomyces lativittatus]|nr:Methyltransferase-like protein 23 [Coelomomyces lativittatus]